MDCGPPADPYFELGDIKTVKIYFSAGLFTACDEWEKYAIGSGSQSDMVFNLRRAALSSLVLVSATQSAEIVYEGREGNPASLTN